MKMRFGHREMDFPGPQIGYLRDSRDLLDDTSALHARLAEDGYLLIGGLIDRQAVLAARARVMEHMANNRTLVPGQPVLEGVMPQGGKNVNMMGYQGITQDPVVSRVLAAPELFRLFECLFGESARTFDYKWLRAVGNEEYTGAHYDIVYMGRGSSRLHTAWIPMGDIEVQQGTLAMCVGSHDAPEFEKLRQTYGRMDVDRDRIGGWFTEEPLEITEQFGGHWATTDYRMGDVILFGMYMMHASTTNLTDRFRLSCDVRFQPASDPADDRWTGKKPKGHDVADDNPKAIKPIAVARAEWGV